MTAIVESAFQSAGQRCSALRCLYVQDDIADDLLEMLKGAADELRLGNPWDLSTDVGPLIDSTAKSRFETYIAQARHDGRVFYEQDTPNTGHFLSPTMIEVSGISEMQQEIFGPVLHVARFKSSELDQVIRYQRDGLWADLWPADPN